MKKNLVKSKSNLKPKDMPKYSFNDIKRVMAVYSDLVYLAGVVDSYGPELDAPGVGALEKMLEMKERVEKEVPPELRRTPSFKKYLSSLEAGISYCSKK